MARGFGGAVLPRKERIWLTLRNSDKTSSPPNPPLCWQSKRTGGRAGMVAEGLWRESNGKRERQRGRTRTDREKLPWNWNDTASAVFISHRSSSMSKPGCTAWRCATADSSAVWCRSRGAACVVCGGPSGSGAAACRSAASCRAVSWCRATACRITWCWAAGRSTVLCWAAQCREDSSTVPCRRRGAT